MDDFYDLNDANDNKIGEIYLKLRFGEPREDGDMAAEDNIFAPKLCTPFVHPGEGREREENTSQ